MHLLSATGSTTYSEVVLEPSEPVNGGFSISNASFEELSIVCEISEAMARKALQKTGLVRLTCEHPAQLYVHSCRQWNCTRTELAAPCDQ